MNEDEIKAEIKAIWTGLEGLAQRVARVERRSQSWLLSGGYHVGVQVSEFNREKEYLVIENGLTKMRLSFDDLKRLVQIAEKWEV